MAPRADAVADRVSFSGAKIAVFVRGEILTLHRDDIPDIDWPGHWDLPGGGNEGDEGPLACALRELEEELCIALDPARVVWSLEETREDGTLTWFFVAFWDDLDLAQVKLGDEGQAWATMTPAAYLSHPKAIPSLVRRLGLWLAHASGGSSSPSIETPSTAAIPRTTSM